MRLHQVDLQFGQMILAYRDIAERAKARGHAIDGFFTLGNLLVQILTAAHDAVAGILAEFEFATGLDDFSNLFDGQMFGRYLVYSHIVFDLMHDK